MAITHALYCTSEQKNFNKGQSGIQHAIISPHNHFAVFEF